LVQKSVERAGREARRATAKETELGGDVTLEDLDDLLFGHGADQLVRNLSALENQQRGNAANAEFGGDIHILIDIELYNLDLAGMFASDFFHRRRKHVAGAAPIRPEIDHDGLGLASFNDVGLEASVTYGLNGI
jgi:hypothetical protein